MKSRAQSPESRTQTRVENRESRIEKPDSGSERQASDLDSGREAAGRTVWKLAEPQLSEFPCGECASGTSGSTS
jgi:hypothetical protein